MEEIRTGESMVRITVYVKGDRVVVDGQAYEALSGRKVTTLLWLRTKTPPVAIPPVEAVR